MYKNYLPDVLPENWIVAELDEPNGYLEFLGYDGEFLVSVMDHSNDNPLNPYFLSLNQMKGILSRFEFETLGWKEWYPSAKEAIESALELIKWMKQNYSTFVPLTHYVFVSLGTEGEIQSILRHFGHPVVVQEFQNQRIVFREVQLTWGATTHSEAALRAITLFYKMQGFSLENLVVGYLTNEKFQLIEDLRPFILNRLSKKQYG